MRENNKYERRVKIDIRLFWLSLIPKIEKKFSYISHCIGKMLFWYCSFKQHLMIIGTPWSWYLWLCGLAFNLACNLVRDLAYDLVCYLTSDLPNLIFLEANKLSLYYYQTCHHSCHSCSKPPSLLTCHFCSKILSLLSLTLSILKPYKCWLSC